MSFSMRIYDDENRYQQLPGESMRDAAIRRTRERAAELHIRLIDEPEVTRIDDGPPTGSAGSSTGRRPRS